MVLKTLFDECLNSSDITPVHKTGDTNDKRNYRPVFERIIQQQIGIHMEKYLCGYRKDSNLQHAILSLLGKWRIIVDRTVAQWISSLKFCHRSEAESS